MSATPTTPSSELQGANALIMAARNKIEDVEIKEEELNKQDAWGNAAITYAAWLGLSTLVQRLLEHQADPSIKNQFGFTALHAPIESIQKIFSERFPDHQSPRNFPPDFFLKKIQLSCLQGEKDQQFLLLERYEEFLKGEELPGSLIHNAARSETVDQLMACFALGCDINEVVDNCWRPIDYAVMFGSFDVVKRLVDEGVDLARIEGRGHGQTPLEIAIMMGRTDVAKLLIELGGLSVVGKGISLLITALAGNVEIAHLLVEKGVSVNDRYASGNTPLHVAAGMGHVEMARFLFDLGASVSATDDSGNTPLHVAAEMGHVEMAHMLVEQGALLDALSKDGLSPVHLTLDSQEKEGHLKILRFFLEKGASISLAEVYGSTLLQYAITNDLNDSVESVRILVEHGASVNSANSYGRTPLHEAAARGRIKIIDYLVQKGAPVNIRDKHDFTPLHDAAERGTKEVVDYLIKKGALVDSTSETGKTPLHIAAYRDKLDAARCLIAHGASVIVQDKEGNTPLHLAGREGGKDLAHLLIEHGGSKDTKNKHGKTPLDNAILSQQPYMIELLTPENSQQ